jgi:hypothetical protein
METIDFNLAKNVTRLIHDQFAKDYLQELLSPLGKVQISYEIVSEVRAVDVFFVPASHPSEFFDRLGLLGDLARTEALFEPYRNPVSWNEVRKCQGRLIDVFADCERKAKREKRRIREQELPMLWILTPTASQRLLKAFACQPIEGEKAMRGVYRLPEGTRTGLVAIHQLPQIPQTLWLRVLGRGNVQEKAIAELAALPADNPLRENALQSIYQLQAQLSTRLQQDEKLDREDRELIMAIAPLFREQLAAARLQGLEEGLEQGLERGLEQGLEQGRIEGQRSVLENFLQVRLGELDPILRLLLAPVAAFPTAEFAMLLVRLSMLAAEENATAQAKELLAQALLQKRFGQLEERWVPGLLALSVQKLGHLLSCWNEVADEEILGQLEGDLP